MRLIQYYLKLLNYCFSNLNSEQTFNLFLLFSILGIEVIEISIRLEYGTKEKKETEFDNYAMKWLFFHFM